MNITRFKKRAKACGICINEVEFQGKLDCCEHAFCFDCIKEWAKIENSCPLCKIRFMTIEKIPHRVFYASSKKMKEVLLVGNKSQNIQLDPENFHLFIDNAQRLVEDELQRLVNIL